MKNDFLFLKFWLNFIFKGFFDFDVDENIGNIMIVRIFNDVNDIDGIDYVIIVYVLDIVVLVL